MDISYQYVNDSEDELYPVDEMNQFLDDAIEGKIDVACNSFIEVYREFAAEAENDDG